MEAEEKARQAERLAKLEEDKKKEAEIAERKKKQEEEEKKVNYLCSLTFQAT